ncbi:D-alanyl-D-alanine carboxypeptidase OS=Bosea thiooxidans OX=53254 GN=SAMN05660750_03087 PE=3 SV=1 [Bosea thiooxidans]|uniref:D-alanyl-D-alanine carboxypeptidase n=1 Tax=Bosea thiooxidans TaxID=53254 RepID=A0A1T5FBG2_9HYPH|nr:SPOR domain-containing protein [Bosea thiooxidans]SKB93467.1 D-alanyl-D-alanine carboxypeptidase [Bosea thiooxidans]
MVLGCVGLRRPRLRVVIGLIGVAAVAATIASSPAEARKRRAHSGGGYTPPYAAMVVDAKTGRTLHAVNEDAARIPASLTKVMTLYMLFEQMERGRFSMDSELRVSSYAASQPPTKLGLRAGSTISVEDAIKSMITLSANDSSVVVAENIAGSEEAFAEQMTRKARSLGMGSTRFYNPHGLPHSPPNLTTARDLTILARAIQERFPKYYPLFSMRAFQYGSRTIRGHNRLLGKVEGVDGIKTGYTRASGFNLMTSAKSEGRHVVSVVLGGRSGASRDKIMTDLVLASLPRASTSGRSSVMVAEAPEPEPRPRPEERPRVAAAEPAPMPVPRPEAMADAPLPAAARAYAPMPTTTPIAPPRPVAAGGQPLQLSGMRPVAATTTPSAMRWSIGAQPSDAKVLRPPANVDVTSSIAKAPEPEPAAEPVKVAEAPAASVQRKVEVVPAKVQAPEPARAVSHQAAVVASGKWVIQLGATDDEGKAKEILARARAKASGSLASASPFTEKVEKGGSTLFRARFAGFDDSKDAQNACAQLKRGGFSCFATRS